MSLLRQGVCVIGKPSAPPAPDYAAAATAQGVANKDTAVSNSSLGNPNVISPYGNQTVTYDTTGPGGNYQPTVTQTLTPQAQQTLDAQQRVQTGLANLGDQAVGTVKNVMGQPFQYNGPQIQTSLPGYGQQGGVGSGGLDFGMTNDPAEQQRRQQAQMADYQAQNGGQSPNLGALNYGPQMGQYGMAGSVNPAAYGQAGSVAPDQYGQAQGGVAAPNLRDSFGGYGNVQNAPSGDQYGQAQGINAGQYGNLQNSANMSNVAAMPVNAGMTAQQAILKRLQPQIGQNNAALDQQLANQGITSGSEAYNNAMRQRDQSNNDLYSQAALQGIGIDMNANQQGYNQAMGSAGLYNAAQGQGFGQAAQAAQLGNQAVGQNFGQGMQSNAAQNAAQAQQYGQAANNAQFGNAAQLSQFQSGLANQQAGNQAIAQNYGQGMSSQQLANQAVGQNYGQGSTSQNQANAAMGQNYGQAASLAGLNNTTAGQAFSQGMQNRQFNAQQQNQNFNQRLSAAQFGNTAAQQAYQQQLAQYNQPLNQITALMSGSQIQNPQFQSYAGSQAAPAPVFQGAQAQGQYATDIYGQRVAAYNGMMGAIGNVAGAGAMAAKSDIRLKSNIVKVGEDPRGFGIYEYDIEDRRERGVMAQEVEKIMPEAVTTMPDGFKAVYYGVLFHV